VYEEVPPLNVAERDDDWPGLIVDGVANSVLTVGAGLTVTVSPEEH